MSETTDPFGRTVRQPIIIWQTFDQGFDLNGIWNRPGGITVDITPQLDVPTSKVNVP
jgi:hypothetical protein